MYSPRISEDLIPILYRLAQLHNKPMTQVVDTLLRDALWNSKTTSSIGDNKNKYQNSHTQEVDHE